jgi:hypothetical protein
MDPFRVAEEHAPPSGLAPDDDEGLVLQLVRRLHSKRESSLRESLHEISSCTSTHLTTPIRLTGFGNFSHQVPAAILDQASTDDLHQQSLILWR